MLTLTQRLPTNADKEVSFSISLTAFERTRSRCRLETDDGESVFLRLPRGLVLRDRDLLQSEDGSCIVQIIAKPEPVFTVTAANHLTLLRAAYHLGNRHVAIEITPTYLRLSPDPVLKAMLEQLGVEVKEEIAPFAPEVGAYGHSH